MLAMERPAPGRPLRKASIGAGPVRDVPETRNRNTVAFLRVLRGGIPGQMMAGGTRPAGISVQVLPSASEPLGPHTTNTTISVPIAAMMAISAPYFRTSSSPDPRRGRDTTPRWYARTALRTQARLARPSTIRRCCYGVAFRPFGRHLRLRFGKRKAPASGGFGRWSVPGSNR